MSFKNKMPFVKNDARTNKPIKWKPSHMPHSEIESYVKGGKVKSCLTFSSIFVVVCVNAIGIYV